MQIKDTSLAATQNTKQPGYYLNQLPKTKEEFIKSNDKIKTALYQLGIMYKEDLNEMKLSSDIFENIFKRFPEDDQYAPLALYNSYINLLEIKDPSSRNIKTILLSKYPNSIYAKIAEDPSENLEGLKKESLVERRYKEVFSLYNRNMFSGVLIKTSNISNEKYKDKLLLLRAFSLIKTNELDSAEIILTQISNQEVGGSSDEGVLKQARHILEAIKDPSKIAKANELANAGLLYLYRPKNKHMVVLVLPKKDVDITYLKTLISDFHRQKISSEVFEISALLLGVDQHLLMVQDFSTLKESMEYYNLLLSEEKVQDALKKSDYKMMSIALENFPEFYKNKDVDGYYKFFINNYFIN